MDASGSIACNRSASMKCASGYRNTSASGAIVWPPWETIWSKPMDEKDSIVYEIVYPHPIWTVWRALTTSEALAQWLMPNDFAPQVGHHFTFQTEPQGGWSGIVHCQVVELT